MHVSKVDSIKYVLLNLIHKWNANVIATLHYIIFKISKTSHIKKNNVRTYNLMDFRFKALN